MAVRFNSLNDPSFAELLEELRNSAQLPTLRTYEDGTILAGILGSGLKSVAGLDADTASDIRTVSLYGNGMQAYCAALNAYFRFDSNSVAADDGATVLKPDDVPVGNPGRWLLASSGTSSSGGIYSDNIITFVSPSAPDAADDANLNTPFLTIQGCMNAIGAPTDAADATQHFIALVAPGQYDEDVTIPGGRQLSLLGLGSGVILGAVDEGAVTITTPRNLKIITDQNTEKGGIRPKYRIGILNPPETSTGQQALQGFWITGNLDLGSLPGGVAATTVDLSLYGTKVEGPLQQAAVDPHSGGLNLYLYRCFFNDGTNSINHSGANVNVAESTEFDGAQTLSTVGRYCFCQIQGNISASGGLNSYVPPTGFFGCDFSAITFNGGAGNQFKVDAYSNFSAKAAPVALAGGTTKLVAADTTP